MEVYAKTLQDHWQTCGEQPWGWLRSSRQRGNEGKDLERTGIFIPGGDDISSGSGTNCAVAEMRGAVADEFPV